MVVAYTSQYSGAVLVVCLQCIASTLLPTLLNLGATLLPTLLNLIPNLIFLSTNLIFERANLIFERANLIFESSILGASWYVYADSMRSIAGSAIWYPAGLRSWRVLCCY